MTAEEQIRRGAEARQVLDNPLVVDAFNSIEAGLVSKWLASQAFDAAGREELYRLYLAARMFKAYFEREISGAEIASIAKQDIEP